ncbi:MAG: selenium metabolism-associated LysR family transcriptional regulator [Planctomycetota bacterium]
MTQHSLIGLRGPGWPNRAERDLNETSRQPFAIMQGMELRHLHTFVIAAELQSFTRAAESLGLTQAAVSQHVAALEKELAAELFHRGSRSVTLTEAGRSVYDRAQRILDLTEEIRREAGHQPVELHGTIKIAASTVPSEWLLPELLAQFRRLYPAIRQSVAVSDSEAATAAVEKGEADLGIVGELPRTARVCARAIADDELVLVTSPEQGLPEGAQAAVELLRTQPLIVREAGSASRRCVEQALVRAGVSWAELNIVMEVNSNDAIRAAVERGVGVSFVSRTAFAREIADGRLVPVPLPDIQVTRQLYLVTDPQRLPRALTRAFLEFVARWRQQHEQAPRSR